MSKLLAITMGISLLLTGISEAQEINVKFTKEGRPADPNFFPVAVWLQGPKLASKYKAAGINCYIGLWKGPTEGHLTELKKHNMPVICSQNDVALNSSNKDIIIAYMHGDEPDNAQKFKKYWKGDKNKIKEGWPEIYAKLDLANKPYKAYGPSIPPKWIIKDYKELKKKDSSKPIMLNLGQGVAWPGWGGRGERTGKLEDYPEYIKGSDVVSFDIYPACHSSKDVAGNLWYVAQGVENLMKWTDGGKKPVWSCIECTRISHPQGKMATPEQVKTEVWMAITEGATGLIYFVHEFKPKFNSHAVLDNSKMLAGVTAINKEIKELAPVLNSPTKKGMATVNSESPINLMVKKYKGSTYLFTVGMRPQATVANFAVKGMKDATAEVIGENRTIAVKNGKFKDEFKPYAVHLYKIVNSK